MNTLEQAKPEEAAFCLEIINSGRAFQREQGFVQWPDNYPSLELLRADINAGKGYVLKVDGTIAGYMCIDFDGDPEYDAIEGRWQTEEPYVVIHRMAISEKFRGMGLPYATFELIEALSREKGVYSVRVDTTAENKRMQHIFDKLGYSPCGVIPYPGLVRLAYDKTLT